MAAGVIAAWAVLGPAATASATTDPGDWYGYAVTGATYTSTTADWTMPAVSCATSGTYVAIWTGPGRLLLRHRGAGRRRGLLRRRDAEYFGWYELYPVRSGGLQQAPQGRATASQASVSYKSQDFTLTLSNVTQGWTQTATKALSGAARSSAETVVEVPDTFSCPKPVTLANVTGDTVDGSALGSLKPVKVVGGNPNIVVSAVNGKSFTVSCRV